MAPALALIQLFLPFQAIRHSLKVILLRQIIFLLDLEW